MKTNKNKSAVSKKETKKEIEILDFSKMTDEKLVDLDLESLDKNNLKALIESNLKPKSKSSTTSKTDIYKSEIKEKYSSDRNMRKALRKKRNYFIENVLAFHLSDNLEGIKETFNDFKEFYKETYVTNDFSIGSLARANSDKRTIVKINAFFSVLKQRNIKLEF